LQEDHDASEDNDRDPDDHQLGDRRGRRGGVDGAGLSAGDGAEVAVVLTAMATISTTSLP
jgi:hypothetical protein